ncbi:MAG TPA: Ku protein [Polyangiaceae bacterium]|nr:Ku protein [Polyangiaceae bacterium]
MPRSSKKGQPPAEADLDENGEPRGTRSFWSGTISFGLVTIPVELYSATRTTRSSLRMLAPSGSPVSRRYFNDQGKVIAGDELARGYEIDKGDYVLVTDDELDSLAPEQSRDIDLSRFVDRAAIPPLFFERAYILAPAGKSNVAYRLLAATLERANKAGIASFIMRGKQYAVAIVAEDGLLRAETLRFADELRTPDAVGLPKHEEPSAAKVKAMRGAIDRAKKTTVPDKELADTYWQRLEALVETKQKKKEDIVTPEPVEGDDDNLAEVIDLVAILKRSLGQKGGGQASADDDEASPKKAAAPRAKPAKKAAAKKAPAKKSSVKKPAKKPATKRQAAAS